MDDFGKKVLLIALAVSLCGCGGSGSNSSSQADSEAPVLSMVSPVQSPTSETEPAVVFHSSESGDIGYTGSCSSITVNAIQGNNTIVFNTLTDGEYLDCVISVTDSSGNTAQISVPAFTVDADLSKTLWNENNWNEMIWD